jgi:hypothetical protein
MTPRKVLLVTGGRAFTDADLMDAALNFVVPFYEIDGIIQGGAKGADALARAWAERNGVKVATIKAEWAKHGRLAGPKRNQRMLDIGRPCLVLAWPGGAGTRDMVARAERAGVPVIRPAIVPRETQSHQHA